MPCKARTMMKKSRRTRKVLATPSEPLMPPTMATTSEMTITTTRTPSAIMIQRTSLGESSCSGTTMLSTLSGLSLMHTSFFVESHYSPRRTAWLLVKKRAASRASHAPSVAENMCSGPMLNRLTANNTPKICPSAKPSQPVSKNSANRRASPPTKMWNSAPYRVARINPKVTEGLGIVAVSAICGEYYPCRIYEFNVSYSRPVVQTLQDKKRPVLVPHLLFAHMLADYT